MYVKFEIEKHYQCYKCGSMFDKATHADLGKPARPFVVKELCPKCYAESNIARARDVDALCAEITRKYSLSSEAGKKYVEDAMRVSSQ